MRDRFAKRFAALLVKPGHGWQVPRGRDRGRIVAQSGNTRKIEHRGADEALPVEATPEQKTQPGKAFASSAIYLLRTTQINTLTLSQMADQKANIMIGATFVVFSLSVTRLMGETITLAGLCLAATAFLSSLCAMIAVMPRVGAPPTPVKHPNLLFFGHFGKLDQQEWMDQLFDKLEQDDTVFETMMTDIYQNGKVLHERKYRFLAYGYRILLGGLCLTMLIFAWEYFVESGAAAAVAA